MSSVWLQEKISNRSITVKYNDYQSTSTDSASFQFSHQRDIVFEDKEKLQIQIKFTRLNWNEALSFPFHIPDKYEFKE